MINPANKTLIQDILEVVDQWEAKDMHCGLSLDLFNALKDRIKPEGAYRCPECKMPADGVSRGCGTCAQRKPHMYSAAFARGRY